MPAVLYILGENRSTVHKTALCVVTGEVSKSATRYQFYDITFSFHEEILVHELSHLQIEMLPNKILCGLQQKECLQYLQYSGKYERCFAPLVNNLINRLV